MKHKCPSCAVIAGEKYRGGKKLCPDCASIDGVKNEFDWFCIVWHMRWTTKVFIPAFTFLLVAATVMGMMKPWNLFPCVVSLMLVLRQQRHYDYDKRMAESRDKMFLAKVSGGAEVIPDESD